MSACRKSLAHTFRHVFRIEKGPVCIPLGLYFVTMEKSAALLQSLLLQMLIGLATSFCRMRFKLFPCTFLLWMCVTKRVRCPMAFMSKQQLNQCKGN